MSERIRVLESGHFTEQCDVCYRQADEVAEFDLTESSGYEDDTRICAGCLAAGMEALAADHPAKAFVPLTRLAESHAKVAEWQDEARRIAADRDERAKAFDLYVHDATIIADLLRDKVTTLTNAIADALLAGNFAGPRMEAVEDALEAALREVTP